VIIVFNERKEESGG